MERFNSRFQLSADVADLGIFFIHPTVCLSWAESGAGYFPWDDPRMGHLVRAVDVDAPTARGAVRRALRGHCAPDEHRVELTAAIDTLAAEASVFGRCD